MNSGHPEPCRWLSAVMIWRQRCGTLLVFLLIPLLALIADLFAASPWGYGVLFELSAYCEAAELPMPLAAELPGNSSRIHVAYSADRGHFPGLLSSMVSLGKHLTDPGQCSIHLIVHASDVATVRGLVGCFRHALAALPALPDVEIHELRPLALDVGSLSGQVNNGRLDLMNPMTFAWFNIHEYLPTAARVIYLDTDTVVRADLGPLFRMHMEHAIAAAPMRRNLFLYRYFPNLRDKEHLVIQHVKIGRRKAHNSGVLLFDLARWRSGQLTRHLEGWVKLFDGAGDADQLALNLEFQGTIDTLDWRWNSWGMGCDVATAYCLRAGGVPRRCVDEARVLHFNGPLKPWYGRGSSNPHFYLFEPYNVARQCEALQ